MEGQITGFISLITSIGTAAFFIIRWALKANENTTKFDRDQIIDLKRRVTDLEKKLDDKQIEHDQRIAEKDKVIERKEREIDTLKQQVLDLKEEVRDLRHRLSNVEQVKTVKRELEHQKDE